MSYKNVTLTYDADNRLTNVARYASPGTNEEVAASTYTYDADSRLTALSYSLPAGSTGTAPAYQWTYDADSRLLQELSAADATAGYAAGETDYVYYATSQLASTSYTNFANKPESNTSENYDLNGNCVPRRPAARQRGRGGQPRAFRRHVLLPVRPRRQSHCPLDRQQRPSRGLAAGGRQRRYHLPVERKERADRGDVLRQLRRRAPRSITLTTPSRRWSRGPTARATRASTSSTTAETWPWFSTVPAKSWSVSFTARRWTRSWPRRTWRP